VVACDPAWVPCRQRPKLSRSRAARPAKGPGPGRGFLRHHCHLTDYAGSIDWCRAARQTYLQDPDLGDDDRHPRDICRGRLRHSHRLRPPRVERLSSLSPAMSALGQKQTSEHDWLMSALPPPKSGHRNSAAECLLCAKSGHMRCSKLQPIRSRQSWHAWSHREVKLLSSLKIDHEFEFGQLNEG
jgi:hypothetical protein